MARRFLRPGDRDRYATHLRLTAHALRRAAERWIRMTDIQFTIREGGVRVCGTGLCFALDAARARRRPSARGLVVVVRQGWIATVYRAEVIHVR